MTVPPAPFMHPVCLSSTDSAWAAQAFVLQVPKAHALSQGATPEASTPFVKQLSARLHAADLDEDAHSVQSSNRCTTSNPVADISTQLHCCRVIIVMRAIALLAQHERPRRAHGGHRAALRATGP